MRRRGKAWELSSFTAQRPVSEHFRHVSVSFRSAAFGSLEAEGNGVATAEGGPERVELDPRAHAARASEQLHGLQARFPLLGISVRICTSAAHLGLS